MTQQTIKDMYELSRHISHDIYQHMPTLTEYAQKVDSIVELGVRTGNSTLAFLNGLKPTAWMKSYDNWSESKEFTPSNGILLIQNQAKNQGLNFELITANDLEIEIPEVDLLFIDTLHIASHLEQELKLHAKKVKKYIIFHDTVIDGLFSEEYGQQNRGLMFAIIPFLLNNPEWMVSKHFTYNNGLLILRKR